MNPPFSLPGHRNYYQDRVLHAASMLKTHGRLAAIAHRSVLHGQDKATQAFRRWCQRRGVVEALPEKSFAPSGTSVDTAIIILNSLDVEWKRRPFQGWPHWDSWQADLWAANDGDLTPLRDAIRQDLNPARDRHDPTRVRARMRSYYEEAAAVLEIQIGIILELDRHDHTVLAERLEQELRSQS